MCQTRTHGRFGDFVVRRDQLLPRVITLYVTNTFYGHSVVGGGGGGYPVRRPYTTSFVIRDKILCKTGVFYIYSEQS